MNAVATFETAHAGRYLGTLCKHFVQKVPATTDTGSGHVKFPFGACDFTANDERLRLVASAKDQARLCRVIKIVAGHLERFAFRENPALYWHVSADDLTS